MHAELLAGRSIVWRDMRAWSQGGEEAVEVVSWDDRLKDFDRSGHFGAIFIEFDVVKIQVEDIPIAGIVAIRADLILWDVVLVRVGW